MASGELIMDVNTTTNYVCLFCGTLDGQTFLDDQRLCVVTGKAECVEVDTRIMSGL